MGVSIKILHGLVRKRVVIGGVQTGLKSNITRIPPRRQ
jgi:hypothetical protein